MKIYGGYIDNDIHHYEVFCVNCTVEEEKIWIEKPEGLSSVVYMTTYPCTYITKSSLNILKTDEDTNMQYVYGFDKLAVFNIIDTERRKALEEAQYLVNQLEKPVIVKGED